MFRQHALRGSSILKAAIHGCSCLVLASVMLLASTEASQARILVSDSLGTFSAASPEVHSSSQSSLSPDSAFSRVEASSRGGSRSSNPDISTPEKFIAVVAEAAQDSQRNTNVPASVTIAQAILESDWGKS